MIPIASPDTLGLPVAGWLAYACDVAFRTAFNTCAGASLGGAIMLVVQRIAAPRDTFFEAINERLIRMFPLLLIAATALGFLPHLFKQALWGNLYLTSTALIGSWWLGVPVALGGAFIMTALLRHTDGRALPGRTLIFAITLLLLKMYVAAMSLGSDEILQTPARWSSFGEARHVLPALVGATFPADFVQLLAGSVALAGIVIAGMAFVSDAGERAASYGFRVVLVGMAIALGVEVWSFLASPTDIQSAVLALRGHEFAMWAASIIAALMLVGTAILGIMRPRNPWWCIAAAGQMIIVVLCYNLSVLAFRALAVRADFTIADNAIRSQPTMLAVFLAGLVLTAAVVVTVSRWMVVPSRS